MAEKLDMFCNRFVGFIFSALAFVILFVRFKGFAELFDRYAVMEIAVIAAVLLAFLLIIFKFNKIKAMVSPLKDAVRKLSVGRMVVTVALFSLITKLFFMFLFGIDSSLHPDIYNYWSFIKQLNDSGIITENNSYAANYTYTVMYATFFLPFVKIFGTKSIFALNAYIIVLFTACSLLLFDLIKYKKNKNYAFAAVMLWNILPIGVFEPLLLVHENVFVILHIVALWLYFRAAPSAKNSVIKAVCVVLSGCCIAYAGSINQFGLISIAAFCIAIFVRFIGNKKSFKGFLCAVLSVLVFLGSYVCADYFKDVYTAKAIDTSNVEYYYKNAVRYGWTVYVGANYESHGTWNAGDAEVYYRFMDISDADEAKDYQKTLLKERFNVYLSHPAMIVNHFVHKMTHIWVRPFNPLSYDFGNGTNKLILHWHGGLIYYFILRLDFFFNLIIAFFCALSLGSGKRKRFSDNDFDNYLKLFMIGVTAILLLCEVTPKYSSHLLFCFITVTVYNLDGTFAVLDSISNRLNKKDKSKEKV